MNQPIKRHGGKHYLAKRIIELMPPRAKNPNAPAANDPGWLHYVEPFFGGGGVLFAQDPEGISEVVNDIDSQLANFWTVLKTPEWFAEFKRIVEATPCSESEFLSAFFSLSACARGPHAAAAFFVLNRQSRQALGKDFCTLVRNRTRRGMQEQVSAWLSAVEGLPEVHARLQRVAILNSDAVKVIRQQDGPRTLYYVDPPYVHETRTVTDTYQHEMTEDEHLELLKALSAIEGRFLLSGYRCDLYDSWASQCGWRRIDIEIDNKSGSGKTKQRRVESVWMNYAEDCA